MSIGEQILNYEEITEHLHYVYTESKRAESLSLIHETIAAGAEIDHHLEISKFLIRKFSAISDQERHGVTTGTDLALGVIPPYVMQSYKKRYFTPSLFKTQVRIVEKNPTQPTPADPIFIKLLESGYLNSEEEIHQNSYHFARRAFSATVFGMLAVNSSSTI